MTVIYFYHCKRIFEKQNYTYFYGYYSRKLFITVEYRFPSRLFVDFAVKSEETNSMQTSSVEEGWIICCVFRKERKERWSNREVTTDRDIVSMAEDQVNLSPTSSSSSSSGIRQMAPISSNESDHEESGGCSTYSSCCRRN